MNFSKLRLHIGIFIFQPRDAPENFRQIQRLRRNPAGFQKLLAVANRVKRCRPRANAADAQIAKAVHYPADSAKPGQIFFESL